MIRNLLTSIFLIISIQTFAQHTFSICAVDVVTGQVGSAGASCIASSDIISDVHPGVGVIHTQASYIGPNQNYAEGLMDDGVAPDDIIDSLVENDAVNNPYIRQYGVADLIDGGRAASYTGESCMDWKGHITGPTYSIQGNILLGPQIIDSMETWFLNTEGNLACKLMAALQGAKVPGADTRCLDDGISALSAFIRVAKPDDDEHALWMDIVVEDVAGLDIDPVDSLQQLFDAIGGCDYTGLHDEPYDETPNIYPQPGFDRIIFGLDSRFETMEIYDMNGRCIYVENVLGKKQVSVDSHIWDAGIYFYKLTTSSDKTVNGKLMVG